MRQLYISIFIYSYLLLPTQLFSQSPQLRAFADSLRQEEVNKQARLQQFADSLHLEMRFELEDGQIIELIEIDETNTPIYYTTFNNSGGQLINADQTYPGGSLGLSLTGVGQRLGIWDGGGVRTTHQEFVQGGSSRVTQKDNPSGLSGHATHVAGTMIAAGVQANQSARGMSYQATLDAYDWSADLLEMTEAAADGLQASQHSYGNITGWTQGSFSGNNAWHWFGDINVSASDDYRFGFYDNRCRSWDLLANNAPEYLIFKSAGNDRGRGPTPGTEHYVRQNGNWTLSTDIRNRDGGMMGYDCVTDAGNAKNVVTVGAIAESGAMSSFSGWGPTDDGRIKPDIVAKGVSVYSSSANNNANYGTSSGTSMSGPMVSGSMGLIHQMYANSFPGKRMLATTAKALILHTANDLISGIPGPDYRYGWGLMDVAKAVTVIGDNLANDEIHMQEIVLQQDQKIIIPIVANGTQPLRVTIAWNDPAGVPGSLALNDRTPKLINDLDLRIQREDGTFFSPYVLNPDVPNAPPSTGDNFRDNVEMIHIASPMPNERYTLTINHKNQLQGGEQHFSIIITGNSPTPFDAIAAHIDEAATLYVLGNTRLPEDVEVAHLEVPALQQLLIAPSNVFTVKESWKLNGELTFEADANGYAIGALPTNFSGTGNLTLQQYVSEPGTYIFGGPFGRSIADQGTLFNSGMSTIASWDAANGDWNPVTLGIHFQSFSGYRIAIGAQGFSDAMQTLSISGIPTLFSTALLEYGELASTQEDFSGSATRSGWNLLANPFPAPLDFTTFDFTGSANMEQAFYVEEKLDAGKMRFAAYSPAASPNDLAPFIAPMQGFWVRANASNPIFTALSFANTTVQERPSAYKAASVQEYIELQVLKNANELDHLTLALMPQATVGFDNGLDARKMLSPTAPAAFFSINSGDYMAINAIDFGMYSPEDKIIPLGLYLDDLTANYFIALNDTFLIENYDLVLEDQFLNVFHDLKRQSYQFNAVSDQEYRFRLHLSNKTVTSASDFRAIRAWYHEGNVTIRSRAYLGNVAWSLYDITGKAVLVSAEKVFLEPTQLVSFSTTQLSAGTYVLKITTDTGEEQLKFTVDR